LLANRPAGAHRHVGSASVSPSSSVPEVPVAPVMAEHPPEGQQEEQWQEQEVPTADEEYQRGNKQSKDGKPHQSTPRDASWR
jgi:hypothetical protein